jgi:hypothetical protein
VKGEFLKQNLELQALIFYQFLCKQRVFCFQFVATELYVGIEPQPLKGIAHCNINPDLPKKQKETLILLVHHEK